MHCRFIQFNTFCEVYVVAFFKVVQQQTIGKVGNQLNVCGRIISVCNSGKIIKLDSICESVYYVYMNARVHKNNARYFFV